MAAHAAEPEQGQLDTSPTLFAVMTAINAAGYDTDADSPNGSPLRAAIRKQLAARQIPCLDALKSFYVEHRRSDPTANLSQYISFALSVDGPPDFSPKGRTADTPPDAVTLEGLTPLLEKFYEQAGIRGSLEAVAAGFRSRHRALSRTGRGGRAPGERIPPQ